MKKLIPLCLFFFPLLANSQVSNDLHILPEENSIPTYTQIITIDSATQTELFNRAKIWFVDHYNDAKNVLQINDKESGILAGKGIIPIQFNIKIFDGKDSISARQSLDIYHTIKIFIKDGKYKFVITDLKGVFNYERIGNYQQEPTDFPLVNRGYKAVEYAQRQVLMQTNAAILKMIESLKEGMQKPVVGQTDW
ncbi:MAG: DUF4468 domain-containing protein [Ginsengibacter sp.]